MTKICNIPYPIYDLTKNLQPYLWPVLEVRYNEFPSSDQMLNYRKHNLRRAFVDFIFDDNDNKVPCEQSLLRSS